MPEATGPVVDPRKTRTAQAWLAYDRDEIMLLDDDVRGYTHVLASRQGIFAVNREGSKRIAHGFFFGITMRGEDVYFFECGDQPRGPTKRGRIIRLTIRGGRVTESAILLRGLDNGCHQIDFIDGRLHMVDTYNQQIVRLDKDMRTTDTLFPLPRLQGERWGEANPDYVHVNSLLQVGNSILLLLHNGAHHTHRQSQIAVYDLDWKRVDTWELEGLGCHNLALLPDGRLLSCGSMAGELISVWGEHWQVSQHLTRGLAVGADGVAVGSSLFGKRDERDGLAGEVTFLDTSFQVLSTISVPCAPTELRRLDGEDASLSLHLQTVPWGASLPKVIANK